MPGPGFDPKDELTLGADSTLYAQVPLDVAMQYYFRAKRATYALPPGKRLAWLQTRDSEERAEWTAASERVPTRWALSSRRSTQLGMPTGFLRRRSGTGPFDSSEEYAPSSNPRRLQVCSREVNPGQAGGARASRWDPTVPSIPRGLMQEQGRQVQAGPTPLRSCHQEGAWCSESPGSSLPQYPQGLTGP